MPTLTRDQCVITKPGLENAHTYYQGLVSNQKGGSLIVPLSVIAFPRVTVPYAPDTTLLLRIGDQNIATVPYFAEALNGTAPINLLAPFDTFPLTGKPIASMVNQDLQFLFETGVSGGTGELLIIVVYYLIWPALGE